MLLPNQTCLCSHLHSKANLLTLGYSEGKYSIYCRAPSKENGQLTFKSPKLLNGFQGRGFKGKVREGATVCLISSFRILKLVGFKVKFCIINLLLFNWSRVCVLAVSSFHVVGVCFL